MSGSFLLGLVVGILERLAPTRYARVFIGTGVIGAYTTFSTFVVEVDLLMLHGRVGTALGYAGVSIAVGFAAVLGGMRAARAVPRRVQRG